MTEFEELKDLMISDQIKKRTPPEFRDHFIDEWSEWNSPSKLVDKLDAYENMRTNDKKPLLSSKKKFISSQNEFLKGASSTTTPLRNDEKWRPESSSISCYGCGKPGVIKAKCPKCGKGNKETSSFSNISLQSCTSMPDQVAILKLNVNGNWGTACADSGASHSIASESLYKLFGK